MNKEMIQYTVTLHANGAITYGEPKEIEWEVEEDNE